VTTTTKTTSGGGFPSGTPGSPPAPPASPPPSGDDDAVLTVDEVYDLMRLPPEKRVLESIAHVPSFLVAGERRFLRGVVLAWSARGGDEQRPPRRGPHHR